MNNLQTLWHSPLTAGGTAVGGRGGSGQSARSGASAPLPREAGAISPAHAVAGSDANRARLDLLPSIGETAPPWWRKPFTLGSLALHTAALASFWVVTQAVRPPQTPPAHPIELILEQARPVETPPSAPAAPPKADTSKPVVLAPPRKPTPVARRPEPKAIPAPAAVAEVLEQVAPAEVTATEVTQPSAPVAQAEVAAPAAASGPVSMEGIPTDYVGRVYQLINQHSQYPRTARQRGITGRVAYRLTLSPAGELTRLEWKTSGHAELDEAAEVAIRRAAPFPRLPELGGTAYLLSGAIVFRSQ